MKEGVISSPDIRILKAGRNCWEIAPVATSGLLIDAYDYYKSFYLAANNARRYILLAGWQFDTQVALLRGKDASRAKKNVRLLPLLSELCQENKELHVFILSWDFSALYALEREWFQDILFSNWGKNDRIHFRFDSSHAMGAAHHRKVAVMDGAVAFVGGMDLCEGRWDDRRHFSDNPLRTGLTGGPYPPVHDIQAYITGKAVSRITTLYSEWWSSAGGGVLTLPEYTGEYYAIHSTLALQAGEVAISRTETRSIIPAKEPVVEIRQLYRDAIRAAENLIYLENQYFSSRSIYDALLTRMNDNGRGSVSIVFILPKEAHALFEKISIIRTQSWMLASLKRVAERYGHNFGVYSPLPAKYRSRAEQTYIHSKLLIVDDRFLMVGSANSNNRGMGLDTEINLSWEADASDRDLADSIRRIRVDLLAEHTGAGARTRRKLRHTGNPLHVLENVSEKKNSRLSSYFLENEFFSGDNLGRIEDAWPLDPERPPVEETLYEVLTQDANGVIATGLTTINGWFSSDRKDKSLFDQSGQIQTSFVIPKRSFVRPVNIRRILFALFIAALIMLLVYLVT